MLRTQPSGGSLATILGLLDTSSLKQVSSASKPYALAIKQGPKPTRPRSVLERLTGVRKDPTFGALTTAFSTTADTLIVERSWSLLSDSVYGPNFEFNEYQIVRNVFFALLVKVLYAVVMVALMLPPVTWLLKKLVYAPGQGASQK